MAKLTAHIHPRNQGVQIQGRDGAMDVVADARVPEDEIWLIDRAGTVIQRVSLFDGQAGTSIRQGEERGTDNGRRRR